MRIDFDSSRECVKVTKLGGAEELNFSTSSLYKGAVIAAAGNVFGLINNYIQTQMTAAERSELWNCYLSAKEILINPTTMKVTQTKLEAVIRDIYNLIDMNKFHYYAEIHGGIVVPANVKDNYEQVDESFTQSRTYLRNDYIKLIVFCTAVRFLIPIWGEFVSINKDGVPEAQKEYRAYELISRSNLPQYPAYRRLLVYINESYKENPNSSVAPILGGIGRENIPEWLAGMLIVRKLGLINLYQGDGSTNVISQVSVYVDTTITNMEKKFGDIIQEKRNVSSPVDGERDPSFLETFRVKQALPYGNIEMSNVYLSDIYNAVQGVDPTIPYEIVRMVIDVTHGLQNEPMDETNITLAQWVMSPAVAPGLFDVMEKLSITNALIASQALLHWWGLHELALLVTGISLQQSKVMMLGDKLARPSLEQLAKLDQIYPHMAQQRTKAAKSKSPNIIYPVIMSFGTKLMGSRKAVRTPMFVTPEQVPSVDRHGHMTVPTYVANHVVDLLVKLDQIHMEHHSNVTY